MTNHFSLLCRLFGNLWYRTPTDPLLTPIFNWLQQQGLTALFPLEIDEELQTALNALQMPIDLQALEKDYLTLMSQKVSPEINDENLANFVAFRDQYSLPKLENANHFALLLLTLAWIEDHLNNPAISQKFCEHLLFPVLAEKLNQLEKHALLPFYRQLAVLTREILLAMADELDASSEDAFS